MAATPGHHEKIFWDLWVVPTLGIRFNARTFAVLRKLGLRGPLWQYLDRLPARGLAAGAGSRH
jgi:hypothetical protein